MPDKTWKAIERKVASLLGGRRVPVTGRQRGDMPDIEHPDLSIEVKHRQSLPTWLFDALDQAEKSAKKGQIPIVILHQKGMSVQDSLTVVRLSDIIVLQKQIAELEEMAYKEPPQIAFGVHVT